jgi:outer membrane protein assembly factor BamD (BamD/ComL family)
MREITGEIRNRIFYVLMALGIVVIAFGCIRGAEQNKEFQNDYIQYQQASRLTDSNQPEEAVALLKPLIEKYPESTILPYEYAVACYLNEDYEEAVSYMNEFIEKRPTMLYNKPFLVQYGEMLFHAGEMDLSRRYLLAGMKGNGDKKSVATAQELLQEIDQKTDH